GPPGWGGPPRAAEARPTGGGPDRAGRRGRPPLHGDVERVRRRPRAYLRGDPRLEAVRLLHGAEFAPRGRTRSPDHDAREGRRCNQDRHAGPTGGRSSTGMANCIAAIAPPPRGSVPAP